VLTEVQERQVKRNVVFGGVTAVTVSLAMPCAAQSLLDNVSLMPRATSCQMIATVQTRGCEVDNIFRCKEVGLEYWRIETSNTFGLDWVTLDEPLSGAVAIGDPLSEFESRMQPADERLISIYDVVAAGGGVFNFTGYMTVWGIRKPLSAQSNTTVEDKVVISGIELVTLRHDDTLTLPPPMGSVSGIGYSYFHPESGIVFGGESTDPFAGPDQELTVFGRPAEIHFPGSQGFGSTTPSYDCGEFSMILPQLQNPKDAS
jgi:hypothetical protein